jgi:ribonuclease P protein component
MLKKADRLGTREFASVIRSGFRSHSPFFIIHFLPGLPAASFRISAAAPKKIYRTAVSRNAFRRRIYAAVRDIGLGRMKSVSVIIIPKRNLESLDHLALTEAVREAFVKGGLTR